jgi:hypothetical protein
MAFGHGSKTAHCLANADAVNHGMHGGDHHSDQGTMPGTHAPGCCGLYCVSALPPAPGPVVEVRLTRPALSVPVEIALYSSVPGRPDRPPIPLLSV